MIPSYIFSLSWLNLYVESESVVRIYLKARVHCQFSHLTSLSDDFLVQLQTTNAKIFHLRFALKFAWTYFIERQITYKNIGGDFFDTAFLFRCEYLHYFIELYVFPSTVDAGYKNTVGSRRICSYIRYVLITGMFYIGNARTVSQEMVIDGSYNRHVLITGVHISGIHCTTYICIYYMFI